MARNSSPLWEAGCRPGSARRCPQTPLLLADKRAVRCLRAAHHSEHDLLRWGNHPSPGKGVRQKSGLNRPTLSQNWGRPAPFPRYKVGGSTVRAERRRTRKACHSCGAVDCNSRRGRMLACSTCGRTCHCLPRRTTAKERRIQTCGMPRAHLRGVREQQALAQACESSSAGRRMGSDGHKVCKNMRKPDGLDPPSSPRPPCQRQCG